MYHVWLALAAALIPAVPVLYLYNRNFEDLNALFVLGLLGLMVALSALLFGVSWALSRSSAAAFWVCLVGWTGVQYSKALSTLLGGTLPEDRVLPYYLAGLLLVMLLVGFLGARRSRPTRGFVLVSCSVLALMLALNLFPLLWKVGRLHLWVRWYLKPPADTVDRTLPSPDVYWLHCDSMMGFQAMQECFGRDETDFSGRLLERGFELNPYARFEALHTTRIDLPALMCPGFYDSYLSGFLSSHEKAMRHNQDSDRARIERVLATRNELVGAFESKGYQTSSVVDFYHWVPQFQPATQRVYYADTGVYLDRGSVEASLARAAQTTQGNGRQMLDTVAHPFYSLAIRTVYRDQDFASKQMREQASGKIDPHAVRPADLEGILPGRDWMEFHGALLNGCAFAQKQSSSPSLTIVYFMAAHPPYQFDAEGNRIAPAAEGIESPTYYPAHYDLAKELVLFMVDRILSQNPESVIVLQGDHGLQGSSPETFQQEIGHSVPPKVLWNNVLCALRVPERFRSGEEARAIEYPLNMSRYLVNSFVGRRYDYLKTR